MKENFEKKEKGLVQQITTLTQQNAELQDQFKKKESDMHDHWKKKEKQFIHQITTLTLQLKEGNTTKTNEELQRQALVQTEKKLRDTEEGMLWHKRHINNNTWTNDDNEFAELDKEQKKEKHLVQQITALTLQLNDANKQRQSQMQAAEKKLKELEQGMCICKWEEMVCVWLMVCRAWDHKKQKP